MTPAADDVTRLVISSVRAQDFGRWRGRELRLSSDEHGRDGNGASTTPPPMTVVFGANQAGKSTFATLIGWLLAGPGSLRAEDVTHLGDPGGVLSGSMDGHLGGEPFSARGAFRLVRRGAIRSELVVHEESPGGVVDHDLVSWGARLGRVDAEVVDAVYFVWGADLHGMADIDTRMKSLSMGQLRGRDPRTAIADLEESARRQGKGRARSDTSVTTVEREIGELDEELRTAASNTDLFTRAERDLAETRRLCDIAAGKLDVIRSEIALIDDARSVARVDRTIRGFETELAALPHIGDEWSEVVAERSRLTDLHHQLTDAETDMADKGRELARTLDRLGTSADDLTLVRITDADIAMTSRLESEWSRTVASVERAESVLASAARSLDDARSKMERAVGVLDRVDAETIARARLWTAEQNSITSKIIDAEAATREADDAAREAERALVIRRAAAAEHDRASTSWHGLGGDIDPVDWMTTAVSRRASGSDQHPRSAEEDRRTGLGGAAGWVGIIALLVTAITAAVVGQWVVVAVAVTAAVVTGVVQQRRMSMVTIPGSATGTTSTTTGDGSPLDANLDVLLLGAATTLIDSRNAMAGATGRAEELAELAARSAQHAELTETELRSHAASFGVHLYAPLGGIRAELDRWSEAVAAAENYEALHGSHQRTMSDLRTLRTELGRLDGLMGDHLRSMGLPSASPPADASELVDAHRRASRVLDDAEASRRALDALRDQWEGFTGPVAELVGGWSRERLLEELGRVERTSHSQDELRREIDHARAGSEQVTEGSPLASIMESEPTDDDLLTMKRRSAKALELATTEWEELNQRVGALSSVLEGLGSRTVMGDLRARIGSLVERQQELAVEAAASLVASRVLGEIAEDYQRRNQPALIRTTAEVATAITDDWDSIQLSSVGPDDDPVLLIGQRSGEVIPAVKLSTGARGLLQLSLRIALARSRTASSGVAMPLICDDPFVHFSDDWARAGMELLHREAGERQVIVFTCHDRSLETARALGVDVVELDEARS